MFVRATYAENLSLSKRLAIRATSVSTRVSIGPSVSRGIERVGTSVLVLSASVHRLELCHGSPPLFSFEDVSESFRELPGNQCHPFALINEPMPTNAGALAAGFPLPLRWPSHLSPASRTGYINGPVARRPSTNPNTGEPCLLDKLDAAGLTVQEYCSKITNGAFSGNALPSPHMLPSVTRHPCADAETLMGVSSTAAAMLCTTGTTKSHPGRTGELRTLGPDGRPGGLRPLFCHTLPHHLPPAPQDQCLRVRCRPGPRGSPTIGSTPRL